MLSRAFPTFTFRGSRTLVRSLLGSCQSAGSWVQVKSRLHLESRKSHKIGCSTHAMSVTAVSSPGKVLLAGGYLVVDREYSGLVFGLSARIHVLAEALYDGKEPEEPQIHVKSPQFTEASWKYSCRILPDDGGIQVSQIEDGSAPTNKFLQTTISYALTYALSKDKGAIRSLKLTILADSDYYSHSDTATPCQANEESQFKLFNVSLSNAHKTGLGSSAALVTSVTAAILLKTFDSEFGGRDSDWTSHIHNLAQIAHCTAQGKIGSGFDVAAAVFGSCVYRRFSPLVLEDIGAVGDNGFSKKLEKRVENQPSIWDYEISKEVSVPTTLRIVMCDVDCGSETPGMVKKVFSWRKQNPEKATKLWGELHEKNKRLAAELRQVAQQKSFEGLEEVIASIRSLIRDMSKEAEVPIEPPEQTALLDTCSRVKGVVGGLVPGAGGFDALALLVEDRQQVFEDLEAQLVSWNAKASTPTKVRLLGAKQEFEGVLIENPSRYKGWI